jgi:hypothetical protein
MDEIEVYQSYWRQNLSKVLPYWFQSKLIFVFEILARGDSVLDMVSRLRPGKSGVRLLAGTRNISLLQKPADRLWVPLCLLIYRHRGLVPRNSNEAGVSLITDLYQELSVRISGATPLSRTFFISFTRTTFAF